MAQAANGTMFAVQLVEQCGRGEPDGARGRLCHCGHRYRRVGCVGSRLAQGHAPNEFERAVERDHATLLGGHPELAVVELQQAAHILVGAALPGLGTDVARVQAAVGRVVALQPDADATDPDPACAVDPQAGDVIGGQARRPAGVVPDLPQQPAVARVEPVDAAVATDPDRLTGWLHEARHRTTRRAAAGLGQPTRLSAGGVDDADLTMPGADPDAPVGGLEQALHDGAGRWGAAWQASAAGSVGGTSVRSCRRSSTRKRGDVSFWRALPTVGRLRGGPA